MADSTNKAETVTEWLLSLSDRMARFEPVDPEEVKAYGRLRDSLLEQCEVGTGRAHLTDRQVGRAAADFGVDD